MICFGHIPVMTNTASNHQINNLYYNAHHSRPMNTCCPEIAHKEVHFWYVYFAPRRPVSTLLVTVNAVDSFNIPIHGVGSAARSSP